MYLKVHLKNIDFTVACFRYKKPKERERKKKEKEEKTKK